MSKSVARALRLRPLGALIMCGASHVAGLIFLGKRKRMEENPPSPFFLLLFIFRLGKKIPLRAFFSRTFSKQRQLVAAGTVIQPGPLPKNMMCCCESLTKPTRNIKWFSWTMIREIQVFTKDRFRCFKKKGKKQDGEKPRDFYNWSQNDATEVVLDASLQQSPEYFSVKEQKMLAVLKSGLHFNMSPPDGQENSVRTTDTDALKRIVRGQHPTELYFVLWLTKWFSKWLKTNI